MTPSLTTEQRNSKLPDRKMLAKPQPLSSNTVCLKADNFLSLLLSCAKWDLLTPFASTIPCKPMVQDNWIGSSLRKHSKDNSQRYPPVGYPSFSVSLALASHENCLMLATTTLFTLLLHYLSAFTPCLSCLEGLLPPLAQVYTKLGGHNHIQFIAPP